MTKEELKQEAEEWLNKWELCNKCDYKVECIEDNAFCPQVVERAYLAGAEPREKRIAKLKAQIEKMKNCRNCKKFMIEGVCGYLLQVGWCKNWELVD